MQAEVFMIHMAEARFDSLVAAAEKLIICSVVSLFFILRAVIR